MGVGVKVKRTDITPVQVDTNHNRLPSCSFTDLHNPEAVDDPPTPPVTPMFPGQNSHESDLDPSKSVFCTTSHNPSSLLVQYALMSTLAPLVRAFTSIKSTIVNRRPRTNTAQQPGLSACTERLDDAVKP